MRTILLSYDDHMTFFHLNLDLFRFSHLNFFFVLWHFDVTLTICFIFYVHRIQLTLVFCKLFGLIFEYLGTRKDLAFTEVSEQSFILLSYFVTLLRKPSWLTQGIVSISYF